MSLMVIEKFKVSYHVTEFDTWPEMLEWLKDYVKDYDGDLLKEAQTGKFMIVDCRKRAAESIVRNVLKDIAHERKSIIGKILKEISREL